MYKRLLSLIIFVFSLLEVNAQVSISINEPPAGIVQKNQLWNINLIYSGNAPLNVTISLALVDIENNLPVMTAVTRSITLIAGVKQLRSADVAPVQYNYVSPAFEFNNISGDFLPIGNYRACYTVTSDDQHGQGVISEDCINLEVQPLSPPVLNFPEDSGKVENYYPQFNWLPPAPMNLFSELNYDLLVTEVFSGQSPNVAVQENLPVYSAEHLTSVFHNYPASFKKLDTGKIYAWRVIAKNHETYAAQSEVWTFRIISQQQEKENQIKGGYLEMTDDSHYAGTAIIGENSIGVKYYSYDKTHNTNIRFLNERGEVVKEITQTIQYGNNFLVFHLNSSFKPGATYSIELKDLQNSRYKTSFLIKK